MFICISELRQLQLNLLENEVTGSVHYFEHKVKLQSLFFIEHILSYDDVLAMTLI